MLKISVKKIVVDQIGDTIIEVLIAIVVIGAVLLGAYTLSTHSLINEQRAEERNEAIQLLQGQFEMLRAWLVAEGTTGNNHNQLSGFTTTTTFCMLPNTQPPANGFTFSLVTPVSSNPGCIMKANGSQAPSNYQPAYTLSMTIQYTSTPVTGTPLFTATATWTEDGGGQGNIQLVNNIYGAS